MRLCQLNSCQIPINSKLAPFCLTCCKVQTVHKWLLLRKGQRRKMGLDSSLNLASDQTWASCQPASQPACRANWTTLTPASSPHIVHLPDLHISILTDARFLRSSHDPIWSDRRLLPNHSHHCQLLTSSSAQSLLCATASHRLQWLLCRELLWFLKSLVIGRILRQPAAAGRIKPRRAHTETGRPPNQSQAPAARFLLRRRRSQRSVFQMEVVQLLLLQWETGF